jgi:hypothetical protein
MDYDEYTNYPGSLSPIERVIKDSETEKTQPRRGPAGPDRELLRWNAWMTQKRAQRRRRWTDNQRLEALEIAVAAADLNLAARGVPFTVRLERSEAGFTIVLSGESSTPQENTAYRSEPFGLIDVDPFTVDRFVADFLKDHGITVG